MDEAVTWLLIIVAAWAWFNIVGWSSIRLRHGRDAYPFSNRIFLGPTVYYKWIYKRRTLKIGVQNGTKLH